MTELFSEAAGRVLGRALHKRRLPRRTRRKLKGAAGELFSAGEARKVRGAERLLGATARPPANFPRPRQVLASVTEHALKG